VDAHARTLRTPRLGPALGIGQVDERPTLEEPTAHEGHLALDPRLVLRVADPGGIDEEPPVLCVLEERVVDPRLGGLGLGDDRRQVVGDEDREDAPEERPGGPADPPINSSVSWSSPPLRSSPRAAAAST
jgi:hypothetical protein